MKNKEIEKAIRLQKYEANKEMYDKSAVVTIGMLQSVIEDYENANEVFPELYPNNLKYAINDFLDGLYKFKGFDKEVAEEHHAIAQLFTNFKEEI